MLIPTLTELTDSLADPRTRHAAMVHAPVVLSLALPVAVGVAVFVKHRAASWVALGVALVGVAAAWMAVLSGEEAIGLMGDAPLEARDLAYIHEEMAEKLWYFTLAAGAGCVGLLFRKAWVRWSGAGLAAVASLGGAVWVVWVAHHGGTLVYAYGIGTPKPVTAADVAAGGEDALEVADGRIAHFRETVRPFLVNNCMGCHGPEVEPDVGEDGWLDLTSFEGIRLGGALGPAVVPGDPQASWLYRVVADQDPFRMPPTGPLPSREDAAAIERWILDGAVWTPE